MEPRESKPKSRATSSRRDAPKESPAKRAAQTAAQVNANRLAVYYEFAERFGWTAREVAKMTPLQQMVYIEEGNRRTQGNSPPGTRTFKTMAEAQAFSESVKKGK